MIASDYKFRVRPAGATTQGSIDSSILLEILAYSVVGAYLLWRHASPPRLRRRIRRPMYFLTFYVGLMLLSLAYTRVLTVGVVRAAEMCVILAIAGAAVAQGSRRNFHAMANAFVFVVAGSVMLGMAFQMPRYPLQGHRFTWLRVHPVVSGVYLSVAVVICVALLLAGRDRAPICRFPKLIYSGLLVMVVGGLIATKTRGAVMGAIAGLVVLLWLSRQGRARIEMSLIMVLTAGGAAIAGTGAIASYFQRGESAAQLASLNSRTDLWGLAIEKISAHPLFGYGIGGAHVVFLDETGLGGAHNAFINVTVDLGLVGLMVWLAVLSTSARSAMSGALRTADQRIERALLLALLVCLLVNGFTNGGLGDESNVSAAWMFFLAAWSAVFRGEVVTR